MEPFSLVAPFSRTRASDDDIKMHFGVHQLVEFSFVFIFIYLLMNDLEPFLEVI